MKVTSGSTEKMDALVELDDDASSITIDIHSPVSSLYREAQLRCVQEVLEQEGVDALAVTIEDNHAIDAVLRARIRSALSELGTKGGSV